MGLDNYKKQTVGDKYELPRALVKLFEFEEEYGGESYSESFCLEQQEDDYSDLIEFKNERQEEKYRQYIKKFAHVDATGGFCAFWIQENATDLENAPVINYGTEGSIRIVAKNINEFLRILTFDVELMDGSCYKFKEDYEESEYINEYKTWLESELNLDPVKDLDSNQKSGESRDIEQIIQEAEEKYKDKFIAWHAPFADIEERFEL